MKKLLITGLFLLAVAAVAVWGNRLLGRVLDAELPPLLSRELGIPVSLAPIRARGLTLTAYTPRLVMGPVDDPALVATGVAVSLDWSDLLDGQIRLRRASGATLMVEPSKWPGNDDPWPDNYEFLDPWLPDSVLLSEGRYIDERGHNHILRELAWQRDGDSATLTGRARPDGVDLTFDTRLSSLPDLLALARLDLELTTTVPGQDDSAVQASVTLAPDGGPGYQLSIDAHAAGSHIQIDAGNDTPWRLPANSRTTVDTLDIKAMKSLLVGYSHAVAAAQQASSGSATLPSLALPAHRGSVAIGEIHLDDESTRNTKFRFTTGDDGISISSLSSTGPAAELQGGIRISAGDAGWQLELTAELNALAQDQSMAPQFVDVDWLWSGGHAHLSSAGSTWDELLNALRGDITLTGTHRGQWPTPVNVNARLDNRPGELVLEDIVVQLGEGRVRGSVQLSKTERRLLTARLTGAALDLDFLADQKDKTTAADRGLPLPSFLLAFPGTDLDWQVAVKGLRFGELNLASARLDMVRNRAGGRASATLTTSKDSQLQLRLDADAHPGKPTGVQLQAELSRIDLPRLFGQTRTAYHYRTSGTMTFQGSGADLESVFRSLRGDSRLSIEVSKDNDPDSAGSDSERIKVDGQSRLVMEARRILGVEITGLHIESIKQDVTGSISLVQGGSPWFRADLKARQLDITDLTQLLDRGAGEQPGSGNVLQTLHDFGPARLSLSVDRLIFWDQPLTDVTARAESAPGRITLQQLEVNSGDSRVQSRGELHWQGDKAIFNAEGTAHDFDLDRFVVGDTVAHHVPVSGSFSLASSGETLTQLLADITGEVDLQASRPPPDPVRVDRRKLVLRAHRIADGMEAKIQTLQWGETELAGTLRFHDTSPPLLELNLTGGSLFIESPGKTAKSAPPGAAGSGPESALGDAVRASADFAGRMLLEPFRLLTGPEKTASDKRFFSTEPLPLDAMKGYDARVKGRLDTLHTPFSNAADITLEASLESGRLALHSVFGQWNSGSAEGSLEVDATASPPTAATTTTFGDVYGLAGPGKTFSRSGFVALTSSGHSPAELAANLNGTAFMTLGKGPLDYRRLTLLTADLATAVFDTLIPGSRSRQPELECGATLFRFKDGIGATPYGYGLRTREANLVGRVELDLKNETLQLEFSSSSRSGIGLSVGNVFSNTVKVRGPLTDPQIVPNTTGILWRGAAAFMTGGLSILGESVLKRTLASENPCAETEKHIRKDVCGTDDPAARSPLVCPGST